MADLPMSPTKKTGISGKGRDKEPMISTVGVSSKDLVGLPISTPGAISRAESGSSQKHAKSAASDTNNKTNGPKSSALNKAAAIILTTDETLRKPSKSLSTANFKVIEEHVTADKTSTMTLFNDVSQNIAPQTPMVDEAASLYTHSISDATFLGHNGDAHGKKNANLSDEEEEFVYEGVSSTPLYNGGQNSSYTNMLFIENNDRPFLMRKASVRSTAGSVPVAGLGLAPLSSMQKARQGSRVVGDNESIASQNPLHMNVELLNHQKRLLNVMAANNTNTSNGNKRLPNIILNHGNAHRNASKAGSVINNGPSEDNGDVMDDDGCLSDNGSYSVSGLSPVQQRYLPSTGDQPRDGRLEKYALMSNYSNYNGDDSSIRTPRAAAKTLIVSQVRKVSDKLFNSRPHDYRRRRLSLESVESYTEAFEEDPILDFHAGPDDRYRTFYENYGSTNNEHYPGAQYGDPESWHSAKKYSSYSDFQNPPRHVQFPSGYNYRNYTNPHDYRTSKATKNMALKILFLLLRLGLFSLMVLAFASAFFMKNMDNPLLDFNVNKLSKLIVTEEMLVFDINTMSRNVNLQDVTITESNLDIFIQTAFLDDEDPTHVSAKADTTILLGNINSFVIPLKFTGLINHSPYEGIEAEPLSSSKTTPLPPLSNSIKSQFISVWYYMNHRNLVGFSKSVAQIRLASPPGYYDALLANALGNDGDRVLADGTVSNGKWRRVINNPFTLIVRGSLSYKLPFKSSTDIISVSKSSKFGPEDNTGYQ